MKNKTQFTISGEEKKMETLAANLRMNNIPVTNEIQLNRRYDYDENDEIIGQQAFVVTEDYARKIYDKLFAHRYGSFEDFLDAYIPETEGQTIYERAIDDNALLDDFYDKEI